MALPNIAYIHSHDTGRYVQPYGCAVPTPNIQKLAEKGILFRKAFCAGPTCSPSRAALVTGQCPHSCGMFGLAHRGFRLNDYRKHIVNTLREAGYVCALAGVQHVAREPYAAVGEIGYDHLLAGKGRGDVVAQAAGEFIMGAHEQPFFLSVGFQETHRPFPKDHSEDPNSALPPAPMPDTPETRADFAAFKASARILDENVGGVLDAIDRAGIADNTLVIYTTDHGLAFPGMKCNLTDHGIGVMLIMRGPGGFEGGKVIDGMVSHVDVFPTICDLMRIRPPDWLEGTSLLPLLRGEAEQIHDAVFSEVTYHAAYEPMRAVRTPRWKYIRRFTSDERPVLANCDDSPSKDVWLAAGWQDRKIDREQLYDLVFDPNEARNLAADPSCSDVKADLAARLAKWMTDTSDPLLEGDVPAPKGAKLNDPRQMSPNDPTRTVE